MLILHMLQLFSIPQLQLKTRENGREEEKGRSKRKWQKVEAKRDREVWVWTLERNGDWGELLKLNCLTN